MKLITARNIRCSYSRAWCLVLGVFLGFGVWNSGFSSPVRGWLAWRGPQQNGMSLEKNLPDKIPNKDAALWVADFPGQSAPVIANGKVYIMGYLGEGPDLQEGVACLATRSINVTRPPALRSIPRPEMSSCKELKGFSRVSILTGNCCGNIR
jgi:hypothetical protein